MSNEQQHDPTVTLRLELGRVTDQRNAYEAALRKEVLVIIREAINETSRLHAEVIRLKAEVDRLTKQNALATPRSLIASQDIKTLREQVERLTKAVMHSPAAQLKLKELEGKITFDEINPKEVQS